MKTLTFAIIVILVASSIIVSQSVFAQQTAKEILQERDNAKKTGLAYNGTMLIAIQETNKTEYKAGEKFSVIPHLVNVGNNVATITHGEPLFEIEVLDQNGNTSFIWPDATATIGIDESLEPGMSTSGRWVSGHGGFPEIVLDKPGNYTIYSIASINSEGMPAHMESIWSKPLQITVLPEEYVQNASSTISQNVLLNRSANDCDKQISDERNSILNPFDKQKAILLAENDKDFQGLVGDSKYIVGEPSVGGNVNYTQCSLINPNIQIQFNVLTSNSNLGNCPYVVAVEDSSASKVLAVDLGSCSALSPPPVNPLDSSQTSTVIAVGGIVGLTAVGLSVFIIFKKK